MLLSSLILCDVKKSHFFAGGSKEERATQAVTTRQNVDVMQENFMEATTNVQPCLWRHTLNQMNVLQGKIIIMSIANIVSIIYLTRPPNLELSDNLKFDLNFETYFGYFSEILLKDLNLVFLLCFWRHSRTVTRFGLWVFLLHFPFLKSFFYFLPGIVSILVSNCTRLQ